MPMSELNFAVQSALARAECPSTTTDETYTLSLAVKTLLTHKDELARERDEALALAENLKGRIEEISKINDDACAALQRAESRQGAKLELLKEAAFRALEYVATPNPYSDPDEARAKVISHLEDALEVNGSQVLRFEIKSDKN